VLFDRVPIGRVHLMLPGLGVESCIRDYTRLLAAAPLDIVCLGIGVNGHLAFNDPPVADFTDPVDIEDGPARPGLPPAAARRWRLPRLEDVPRTALTLTIPRLLRSDRMFCVIPGPMKRDAVRRTLNDPIGEACPATALRTHPACTLYVDKDSLPEG